MCSTIALKESLAACIRSGLTPIVAYQPAPSTLGVSGPGVANCGAGMFRSLCRSKRRVAYIGDSMPVTQTSPSPWAAWASPHEKRAPGTCTGRKSLLPFVMWRGVRLAPDGDGACQGVDAVPVEGGEGIGGRAGRDLAVAHLAGLVGDRVAGRDGDDGVKLIVPDVVDPVLGVVVRLRHSRWTSLVLVPFPDGTLSAWLDFFHL